MSIAAISWVFKQEIKPSSLKFVLVALADCADDKGICWPSVEHITETTSQDRKTVIKSLDELESRGWLVDTGKRMGRTNQVKVYRLTDAFFGCADTKACVKSAENGTVSKESRISAERVPDFRAKSTENGIPPTPPYRADPSINPSVDDLVGRVDQVFLWLQEFLNSPSPLFTSPIAAWLTWGADFELDIKPVARRWKQSNPKKAIRSLEWLDADIAASIQKRRKPMPETFATQEGSTNGSANYSRKSKSEAADDAMREALVDLGIAH